MNTVVFGIVHYLGLLVLWALAYGCGRRALQRGQFTTLAERIAFSTAAGLGLLATAVFFLGLASWLTAGAIIVLTVVATLVSAAPLDELRRELLLRRERRRRRPSIAAGVTVALVALPILYFLPQPLYPPHLWDALSYHLPFAKWFAMSGEIGATPHLRFPVFPQLQETMFAAMLTVADDVLANLTQFLSLIVIVIATFDHALRRFGPAAAILACGVILGIPSAAIYASTSYVDIALAMYAVLCVLAIERWRESGAATWAAIAGLMGGFAASTKYTGLVIIAVSGITLVIGAVRTRNVRPVVAFSIACAAVAAPWYLRNWIYAGNPVFPVMAGLFGGDPYWRPQDYKALAEHWKEYGDGRSLVSFLKLPWNLTFRQELFEKSAGYSYGFLLLPLALIGFRRRETRFFTAVIFFFVVYWFFQAQILRYLLPIIPIYAIVLAATAVWLLAKVRIHIPAVVAAILFVVMLIPTLRYLRAVRVAAGDIPTTADARDLFFNRFGPYRCYQWLNEEYGRDYVLYSFTGEEATYFADGARLGDIFGNFAYDKLNTTSAEALAASLRGFGAGFLMSTSNTFFGKLRREPAFERRFQVVCGSGDARVWKLSEGEPLAERRGPDLLESGAFGSARDLTGGEAIIDSAYVEPKTLYEITIAVEPDNNTTVARAMRAVMEWRDEANRLIGGDSQELSAPPTGAAFDIPLMSPPRAHSVRLAVVAVSASLRLQRVSMEELTYVEAAIEEAEPIAVTVPAEHPIRGMSVLARSDDEAVFAIAQSDSIVEIPVPPAVPAARRWRVEFDLQTNVSGPFLFRFIGTDGTVSAPVSVVPAEPGQWKHVSVVGPESAMPALRTFRLDPPAAARAGEFRLRGIRITPR